MRPVSEAWESTLRGSHRAVFRAIVCDTFQTGVEPDGTVIPVVGGSVSIDGNAAIRSTVDLTTDGTRMWPRFAADLFAPYGNEVYVSRGIQYSDSLTEFVGLGYHRIQTPDQADVPDGPIRLQAEDRMAAIIEARLLTPREYPAGTTLGTIVAELVTDVYPLATVEWDDATDTETLTRGVVIEQDRYGFLNDLVTSRGKIWYWDHRGVLTIKDLPDPTQVVFDLDAGRFGELVTMRRKLTREGVYNAVVASGEAATETAAAFGVATDSDPESPTFFGGRFGQVPRFYTSTFLTTDAQAVDAAFAILRRQLGLPYVVSFGSIPNAALEPFDPVRIRYSDRDAPEVHVLEKLTIPLTEDTDMTADTRERSVVLLGSP